MQERAWDEVERVMDLGSADSRGSVRYSTCLARSEGHAIYVFPVPMHTDNSRRPCINTT